MARKVYEFKSEWNVEQVLGISVDTMFPEELTLSLKDKLGTINFDLTRNQANELISILMDIVEEE